MGFSEVSVLMKVALVLLPIALLLQIIGIATVYWASNEVELLGVKITANTGLWRTCTNSVCLTISSSGLPSWWVATRAFGIIGVLVIVASVVVTILCVFLFTKAEKKIVYILNLVLAFIAGGALLLSIIIFGAKYDSSLPGYKLSWSFALSVVAAIMSLVGGGLLTADFMTS